LNLADADEVLGDLPHGDSKTDDRRGRPDEKHDNKESNRRSKREKRQEMWQDRMERDGLRENRRSRLGPRKDRGPQG